MAEIFLNIKGQLVAEESGQYFIIPAIPIESSDAKRDEKIEPAEVPETVETEIAVDPTEVALVPKDEIDDGEEDESGNPSIDKDLPF